MTFKTNQLEYRIMFDTSRNQFMAISVNDESKVAFGMTIEKAVHSLNTEK